MDARVIADGYTQLEIALVSRREGGIERSALEK
jgi:hypothetical protein